MSTRYGKLKQLDPVGPTGEALLDYGIHDALLAGFEQIVLVIREELEDTFRDHCGARWPGLEIAFAHQRLDQVPAGAAVPADRMKPWGTAHAALAAAPHVDGACAVCNADDLYGRTAYRALADHLTAAGDAHALVGYRLDETLSAHGGVSRGICETDGSRLRRLAEVLDIRRDDGHIRGRGVDGRVRELDPGAPVSMNLWGFRSGIFTLLDGAFAAFLARPDAGSAEFLLSDALGDLAAAGRVRLDVLPTAEHWLGMTHPADRAVVVARLHNLVADGRYPARLGTPA